MKDERKTKKQFIDELAKVRPRLAEVEAKPGARREAEEAPYKAVVQASVDGFWLVDSQGRFLDVNDAYCRLTGYTRDELLAMKVQDVEAVESPEEIVRHRRKVLEVGYDRFETRHRRKDGRIIDIEVSANRVDVDCGRLFVFLRDITGRKQAEAEIQRRNAELAALNAVAETVSSSLHLNDVLNRALDKVLEIAGLEVGSMYLLDQGTENLVLAAYRGVSKAFADEVRRFKMGESLTGRAAESGEPIVLDDVTGDHRVTTNLARRRGIRSFAAIPIKSRGKVQGVMHVASRNDHHFSPREVQFYAAIAGQIAVAIENAQLYEETQRAEEALRESEEKLRVLFEQLPIGVSLLDQNRKMIYGNPALAKILDISREDLLRGKYQNRRYIRPDGTPMPPEEYASARAFREQQPVRDVETGMITESGKTIWTSVSAAPFPMVDKGVVIATTDITGRKRAEEELRKTVETLRALVQASPLAILALDLNGKVFMWSPAAERTFGWSEQEALGRALPIVPGDTEHDFCALRDRVLRGETLTGVEERRQKRDGSLIDVSISTAPLRDGKGNIVGIMALLADITERKRAEEALRESEERLKTLFESSPDAYYLSDCGGRLVDANRAAEEMTGYNKETLIGKSFLELNLVPVQQVAKVAAIIAVNAEGKPTGLNEFTLNPKDGSQVIVEVRTFPVRIKREILVMITARDITRRKRVEEARRRDTEWLETMQEIARATLEMRSIEEITQPALERLWLLVPCRRAGVALFDPEGSEATVIAEHPDDGTLASPGMRVPLSSLRDVVESLQKGEVFAAGDVLTLPNPSPALQALRAGGFRSFLMVPLAFHGEVLGSLNLLSDKPDAFGRQDIELTREVADLLAVAIANAQLFKSVTEQRERLRALASRLAETQEAERRSLARELHDQVGQTLTALGISLNIVRSQLSAGPTAGTMGHLEDALRDIEQLAERIRDVMSGLRPPVLDDYGLPAALRWYAQRFSEETGLAVVVHAEGLASRLPPDAEMALFRIAQEALTNVAKHAQASKATVTLIETHGSIRLTITDEGIGFDAAALRRSGKQRGWGLITMQERAAAVGAQLRVTSATGKGTQVLAKLAQVTP